MSQVRGVVPLIPEVPAEIDGVRAEGSLALRYEDVTQDGRLRPIAIPPALGSVVWPRVMTPEQLEQGRQAGMPSGRPGAGQEAHQPAGQGAAQEQALQGSLTHGRLHSLR